MVADALCPALRAPEGAAFVVLTRWRSRLSPCRVSAGRALASTAALPFRGNGLGARSARRHVTRRRRAVARAPLLVIRLRGSESA